MEDRTQPTPSDAEAAGIAGHGSPTPPPDTTSWWRIVLDALRGKAHDYTSGNLNRAIVLLAIPMVLEMAMESVFAVVDVYLVSRLGDAAVATVTLTESMLTIVFAIAIGLAMSTTALVARRIGEKNVDGAVRAATQSIAVGIAIAAAIGIPCAFFGPELLALMGASQEVLDVGTGYTRLLLGSNVVIMLLFLNNAIFRGAGDASVAMYSLWFANAINLVLDPCLIFGLGPFPELGVTGAAVATTIGRGSGVVFQFWMLRRGTGRLALRGAAFRIVPKVMAELLRVSVGGITQFLIATASWVALMRIVAPFGDAAIAGYGISLRILIFSILPSWGLSNAAATLVGQNLGAGRPDRAERSVWLTGFYNMAFLGLVMVVFLTLAPQLIGIFTADPVTAGYGVDALRIISYGYIAYAWGMVMMQAFNGSGDTMTPTRINFVCFWLCQIPLAYVLARPLEWGPQGVFWSVCLAETLLAAMSIWIFRKGNWKKVQLAADVDH